MKNLIRTKTAGIIAVLLLALTAVSCASDEYYYSPLEGRWELVAVNGIPVMEEDVSEFVFYSNQSGTFGQYDAYGRWNTYPITWDLSYGAGGSDILNIYMPNDTWNYRMALTSTTLTLLDLMTGNTLLYSAY